MRACIFLIAMTALAAGCGEQTPTTPSSSGPPATVTERFDAIIEVSGSNQYQFSVNQNGNTTSVNLVSLTPLNRPGLINVPMRIGYGTTIVDDDRNVIGCDLRKIADVTPALAAQLSDSLTPATNYCATISDIGNLREPVNFSIRVSHP